VFAPSTYVRLGVSNTYFIPRPTASAPSAIAAFSVVAQLGVRGVAFALAPSLARRALGGDARAAEHRRDSRARARGAVRRVRGAV
jgi:hypothetical protein